MTGRPPHDTLDPSGLFWETPRGSASVRACSCSRVTSRALPGSPQPLCIVSGEPHQVSPSCRPSRPQHRRPDDLPAVLCSRCAWEFSLGPVPRTWRVPGIPHVLTVAVFTVLEAAVLYQNRKGKATTFLFRFFSQIYRIIAFICLFIF